VERRASKPVAFPIRDAVLQACRPQHPMDLRWTRAPIEAPKKPVVRLAPDRLRISTRESLAHATALFGDRFAPYRSGQKGVLERD
jgi:hypothetical protein